MNRQCQQFDDLTIDAMFYLTNFQSVRRNNGDFVMNCQFFDDYRISLKIIS